MTRSAWHLLSRWQLGLALCLFAPYATAAEPASPWQANNEVADRMKQSRPELVIHESDVPSYELPDPLVAADGTQVESLEQWNTRRAELLELFREHVYGHRPTTPHTVQYEIVDEAPAIFDGTALGRTVRAIVDANGKQFSFEFLVVLPTKPAQPVPAIVFINNREPKKLSPLEQQDDPFWPVRKMIARGYAAATFYTSDVDPDRKDGFADGIRAHLHDGTDPADDTTGNAWGSLSAWGWAASRVREYLSTCPEVNATTIAIAGHSRGGKSALWAACEDPQFAIAYSNNSGCGGAALSRRTYGETVRHITGNFPHWFCRNFSQYAGNEQALPVDQHQVFALLAPRAVYATSAGDDLWADPRGEYLSLIEAAPVYALHGMDSIVQRDMPSLNSPRLVGRTGYHIRPGRHGLNEYDWSQFLNFMDQQTASPQD